MPTTYDIALQSLTPAQLKALLALRAQLNMKHHTATALGVSGVALKALAEKGLADVKVYRIQSSNPRSRVSNEPIVRSYRLSSRGSMVSHLAEKAAKAAK